MALAMQMTLTENIEEHLETLRPFVNEMVERFVQNGIKEEDLPKCLAYAAAALFEEGGKIQAFLDRGERGREG